MCQQGPSPTLHILTHLLFNVTIAKVSNDAKTLKTRTRRLPLSLNDCTQGEIKWSLAEKGTDVKGKFDSAAGGGTYMVDTLVGDEECNYAGVWKIADGQSGFFALCDKNQPPAEAGSD
eukprot:TRINITY_DN13419_c0_g1_i1.p1 TRINITY_DN13419_c0_g1~~TRINITY_DN13419_c0_g1_i1.p1  ORF type:complete len:118 (-),score=17.31 TRINITY_DN13419_c0_g1_i1:201-554(-)